MAALYPSSKEFNEFSLYIVAPKEISLMDILLDSSYVNTYWGAFSGRSTTKLFGNGITPSLIPFLNIAVPVVFSVIKLNPGVIIFLLGFTT